jgi:transcriptional regulator GlxA family with amidase domain
VSIIVPMSLDFAECDRARLARDPVYDGRFARYLQASPSEVARTARVQRAKRLIDETSLPMTEIAMQVGFGSLRRFNSVFAEVYGRPPTEIRRKKFSGAAVLA